jgi:hypothetical protein
MMDNPGLYQFNIEVSASDTAVEDIDQMTRQLLSDLKDMDVESVELAKGAAAPEGSKGDPITIGSIAIAVLPSVLPNVITFVQEWVTRGQGRAIKFKGMGIEFEGSPEELQKLLAKMEKSRKKK